jgi:hypothetical protein
MCNHGLFVREERDGRPGVVIVKYAKHNETKAEIDRRLKVDRTRKNAERRSRGIRTDSRRIPPSELVYLRRRGPASSRRRGGAEDATPQPMRLRGQLVEGRRPQLRHPVHLVRFSLRAEAPDDDGPRSFHGPALVTQGGSVGSRSRRSRSLSKESVMDSTESGFDSSKSGFDSSKSGIHPSEGRSITRRSGSLSTHCRFVSRRSVLVERRSG